MHAAAASVDAKLLYVDGFDTGSSSLTPFGAGSPGVSPTRPALFEGVVSYLSYSSNARYPGANSRSLAVGMSHPVTLGYSFNPGTKFMAGFAFCYTGSIPPTGGSYALANILFSYCANAGEVPLLSLGIDSSGILHVLNSTGANVATGTRKLSPGVWYWIDFYYTASTSVASGACFVDLNGTTEIAVPPGTNTLATGYATCTTLTFGVTPAPLGGWAGSGTAYFDDFYFGIPNSTVALGPIRVTTVAPSADGASNTWTPLSGSSHYAMVDTMPLSIISYEVSPGATGEADMYVLPAVSVPGVIAVQLGVVMK